MHLIKYCTVTILLLLSISLHAQSDTSYLKYVRTQDSIRSVLVQSIQPKWIQQTVLEELYIRNAIEIDQNAVHLTFNFNLHGLDCGAPDCFSTDITFTIPLENNKLVFPLKVIYTENEDGCIEHAYTLQSTFDYQDIQANYVILHDNKRHKTLLFFRDYRTYNSTAYYFPYLHKESSTLAAMLKLTDVDDPTFNDVYFPYMSTALQVYDYSLFLDTE